MNDSDLKIEAIYTQTGTTEMPGGQHAGMPATEIRITHVPTGLMAQCGIHRSQHKNRQIAMAMLQYGMLEAKL